MEIPTKTKIKLVIVALLVFILAGFLLLNTQTIEVNLIVATVEIRRSAMIIGTFVIGLFAGWTLKSFFTLRGRS